MPQVTIDNGLGHGSRHHLNIFFIRHGGQEVIFEWQGKNLPGLVQILDEHYIKNGKWSHTSWTLDLAPEVTYARWAQDTNGKFIPQGTWATATEALQARFSTVSPPPAPETCERFIRSRLQAAAAKLDQSAADAQANPAPVLADLISAQTELAQAQARADAANKAEAALRTEINAAIEAQAEAARLQAEAAATEARVAKAKAAMAKGASLADLQALLG